MLTDDLPEFIRNSIQTFLESHGTANLETIKPHLIRALQGQGVDFTNAPKALDKVAQVRLRELVYAGRIRSLGQGRYAPLVWHELPDLPDYFYSERGGIYNPTTKQYQEVATKRIIVKVNRKKHQYNLNTLLAAQSHSTGL